MLHLSKAQSFFLFGPRGSGKSTLLKSYFSQDTPLWVDLLDQKLEFQLAQNPDSLLDLWKVKKNKWVVIDEVQKIPRLLDVVHQGIENHKIRFALTGSSSRKLKRGSANLLGGRAASFSLAPFSAFELGSDFDLKKALALGLLPKFWSRDKLSPQDIERSLYSYVQTYLKEEVAAEQLVRNLDPFRRFLISAAQMNGKILNFANLEKDAGIPHSQAERHFEILCDTLIGRYLEPYENSLRKRQSKKSKFYFFDTGVLRALKNLAGEPLQKSTFEYGEIFETFLINEFFKLKEALEKRWNFSYLRTGSGVEIDLLIEKPRGKPILVEIKSFEKLKLDQVSSFLRIAEDFVGSPKFILSNDPQSQNLGDVQCRHWRQGLKEIFELEDVLD